MFGAQPRESPERAAALVGAGGEPGLHSEQLSELILSVLPSSHQHFPSRVGTGSGRSELNPEGG